MIIGEIKKIRNSKIKRIRNIKLTLIKRENTLRRININKRI